MSSDVFGIAMQSEEDCTYSKIVQNITHTVDREIFVVTIFS